MDNRRWAANASTNDQTQISKGTSSQRGKDGDGGGCSKRRDASYMTGRCWEFNEQRPKRVLQSTNNTVLLRAMLDRPDIVLVPCEYPGPVRALGVVPFAHW